ncbi:hypothetical protein D5086_021055 [Populus alba]|uniref:Uncharacterized protein n=1 Tax=Populus alba TaxID=43335 RepID=A0ACC4BME8_POPAL
MNSWIYIQPIPVINKPLSAGVYYILNSGFGCQRGLAYTSCGAKSGYKFCFSCEVIHDVGPKPLDASNKHQQFYITRGGSGFRFKSLASDGHDPKRLQSLHHVETEVVYVFGMENCQNAKVIDRIKWFEGLDKEGEAVPSVGLDRVIIEKIIRDQESFGWVRGKDKVKGVERFEGEAKEWKEFGCYMLVERYILRRPNKTLVLTWEFRHAHRIRCKWE